MPPKRRKPKPKPGAGGGGGGGGGASDKLTLNKQFAERYEASERRRLLSSGKYVPGLDSGEDSSSSSEEDEHAEQLTKGIDRRVRDALVALQSKDPRIYDESVKFFGSKEEEAARADKEDDEEDADDAEVDSDDEPVAGWDTIAEAAKRDTPQFTVKDYVRENLLEHGKLSDDESDDGDGEEAAGSGPDDHEDDMGGGYQQNGGAYDAEEVMPAPKAKLSLDDEADDDGDGSGSDDDFFKKREKTKEEEEQEERDFEQFITKTSQRKTQKTGDDLLLHSYLEKETPDEKERFLRDFVLNNGWLDRNQGDAPRADDYTIEVDLPKADDGDDEDGVGEADANAADEFEERNDAFEAKYNFRFEEDGGDQIATHARTIPDSMRRPDDRRKQARAARRERKRQERQAKTEDLKRVKNVKKREIRARLLAIREAAGEEVDVNGLDLDGDFDPDKFNSAMESRFGDEYYARGDDEMADGVDKSDEVASATRTTSDETTQASDEVRQDVDRLMEEYYNLDFEDIVGGTPVRFKYKQVEPETFGMTTEDILGMDDKELNRTVSLKYLAPYRSRRDVQKQAWKARNKLNARGNRARQDEAEEANGAEEAAPAAQDEKESASKRKRKKRKKEPKVTVQRGDEAEAEVKKRKKEKVKRKQEAVH